MIDLTEKQIRDTLDSFDKNVSLYSNKVEWDTSVSKTFNTKVLQPFLLYINQYSDAKKPVIGFMGCGTGRNMFLAMLSGSYKCIGYDFSKKMLEEGRKRVPDGEFVEFDITNDSFEDDYFDGIMAESVLNYIKRAELKSVLQNFYTSLKPGGIALIGSKVDGNNLYTDTFLGDPRYYISYPVDYIKDHQKLHEFAMEVF